MTEQTDRELIELAAKAYGEIPIPLVWIRPFDNELTPINNRGEPWNPLNDDGDALRLAVKLGITDLALAVGRYVMLEKHREGDNIEAITRRAIVRAAAEIGKAMP